MPIIVIVILIYHRHKPIDLNVICADHSGRAVKGINCLHSLKHWGRVFESHLRHGYIYAHSFYVCAVLCKSRGLVTD
jgi:hypothetical protein